MNRGLDRTMRVCVVVGLVVLVISILSEVRAVVWWSDVRLPPRGWPDQRFVSLSQAQVRIGRRGTSGFFTRSIPETGLSLREPRRIPSDLAARHWFPGLFKNRQTHAYSLPLYPLGALLLLAGAPVIFRRRQSPGHCGRCGYSLAGIRGPCPECGGG
jgi:hypothetical protein